MKLPVIIVSDPHFTANPADEYRWGLWPWLAGEITAEKARTLLILGDLTDAKDYHSAELVNRLTSAIAAVPIEEVVVLAGNHDWLKQGGVFFKFLQHLQKPRVRVITEPAEDLGADGDPTCMFLPFTKSPARDWKDRDFSHYDYLFMHQTAPGSIASNGQKMDGDELPPLNAGKVYSGDIHVPQTIGQIEYVGSPYHVHFGDSFKPRCLVIDRKRKAYDLHFETITRRALSISSLAELGKLGIEKGDQIKITVHLSEAEAHQWTTIRWGVIKDVKELGAHLHGIKLVIQKTNERLGEPRQRKAPNPADAVVRFVTSQELGADVLDSGLEIIEK